MHALNHRTLRLLSLCLGLALLAFGSSGRQVTAGTLAEQRPQNVTVHFEGDLIPLVDEATANGDTIAFDVTYDGDGVPTVVDYQFAISSLVVSQEEGLLCATGGRSSYSGQTENILPWPEGNPMYTFMGDERPGGVYPVSIDITGLLGRSLSGRYIGPNHSQGIITAFYEVSIGGASFTARCLWKWAISNGPGGILRFSEAQYQVGEKAGTATITVVREEVLAGTVTVDYATSDISAQAGQDYTQAGGTLTFGPGETQQQFTVSILTDQEVEGVEELRLTLSAPSEGGILDAPNPAILQIDDTPNLAVLAFDLDDFTLVQEGSRFVLKDVVAKVVNLFHEDGATVPKATVEVKSGGTLVHSATVGPLAPGGAPQEIQFDWDVTDLLVAGGGQALATLTVHVDPGGAIPDRDASNNIWTDGRELDVLPVIETIVPQYELDGRFFLQGVSVENKIQVTVSDWNGEAQGQGVAPYGQLHFNLNGMESTVPGQLGVMEKSYDMGSDLGVANQCAANVLSIWAEGAHPSFLTEPGPPFQTTAVSLPVWVVWVKAHLSDYDLNFKAEPAGSLVNYTYGFSYPEPPFGPHGTVPEGVPILGGEVIGFQPATVATVDTSSSSAGPGTVMVTGQTGFTSPIFTGAAQLFGSGETMFRCKNGVPVLDFDQATFGFAFDHERVNEDLTMGDIVPNIGNALADIPYWGPELAANFNNSSVSVGVTVGGGLQATFRDQGAGELVFDTARGTAQLALTAAADIQLLDEASLFVSGGGTPYVRVKVPPPPADYLEEIGVNLAFQAEYQLWSFGGTVEAGASCSLPGGCNLTRQRPVPHSSGWQLLAPMAGGPGYATFQAASAVNAASAVSTAGSGAETILVTQVYTYPAPALAIASSGERLLATVHEDLSAPPGRGTEIRVLAFDGSSWQPPVSVTSDQQPDFNPALAFDGNGKGVLLWEHSTLAPGITPALDITFTQSLEIWASHWDGSAWSSPTPLTSNGLMDRSPQLAQAGDGTLFALWQTGKGDTVTGTLTDTITLNVATWDGAAWSSPVAAVTGLSDLRQVRLAARSASQAALVLVKGDGADTELFRSTFDGSSWSALQAVTDNGMPDESPGLAYDSSGRRHLIWLAGGELRWLVDSWAGESASAPVPPERTGAIQDVALVPGPSGRLAMTWQGRAQGQPGMGYALYDPAGNGWSAPLALAEDQAVESFLSPAFDSSGGLHLGYRKTATSLVTRTLTLSNSQVITVPNVLALGQSDLATLAVTPEIDLRVESLTVSPANPAPGQAMTLTAVLGNGGDLTASTPQLRFLDGATVLETRSLPDLGGGYTQTVTLQTTLGGATGAHTIRAVADPDGLTPERDESNNEGSLVTSLPDLRVTIPGLAHSSSGVTVTLRLRNQGVQATASGFSVTLRAGAPVTGTKLAEGSLAALASGGTVTATLVVDAADLATGDSVTLWATVDEANQVAEWDEGNNRASWELPLGPDLTVGAGDVTGQAGQLRVTVHNQGLRPSSGGLVWVSLGSDAPTGATAIYTGTLEALSPGGEQTLTLAVSPGRALYGVWVDGANQVAEMDEANNLVFRRLTVDEGNRELYLPLVSR